MPVITPAAMTVVADLLNTHAVKLTDSDKSMIMDIGMAFKIQMDVDQSAYDAWEARILLIREVVTHT